MGQVGRMVLMRTTPTKKTAHSRIEMTRQDWKEMPWLLVMLLGGWGLLAVVVLVIYGIVSGKYST